jgi:hypothetical protein
MHASKSCEQQLNVIHLRAQIVHFEYLMEVYLVTLVQTLSSSEARKEGPGGSNTDHHAKYGGGLGHHLS